MDYLLLSTLSFAVGIVVGLTGIGGASLITPIWLLHFVGYAILLVTVTALAQLLLMTFAPIGNCRLCRSWIWQLRRVGHRRSRSALFWAVLWAYQAFLRDQCLRWC
ncbi:MAG TPA: hypothetical protein V6D18_01195 [Thermosynechococcaceae cyanobacterium]